MAKRVYCTYFDHNYLARGLAMYHSLVRHAPGSKLWVLCLSETCYDALAGLALPDLVPRRLADFERSDPQVAATRPTRSLIEYYFTCSPAWKLHVFEHEPDAEWVTYLDSDLFFFASPEPLYAEMGEAAFGIIPHRFSRRNQWRQRFGIYNVGWVSVRRREDGLAALRWWRERCIEWCYDHVDADHDRYADQRYLNRVPGMFAGVHVYGHLGANVAPWNLGDVSVEWRNGQVLIGGRDPLLFFHFHGVKRSGERYFNSHRLFHAPFSPLLRQQVYEPYVAALSAAEHEARPHLAGRSAVASIRAPAVVTPFDRILNVARQIRATTHRQLDVLTGRVITSPGNSTS